MGFSETILLPSRGIIYSNCSETLEVTPFTTKAYKDLVASNGSETGLIQFIDTCLHNSPIKAKNLNKNDLFAILFKIRAITLGSKLKTQVTCPKCELTETIDWDLEQLEINYLFTDEYPISVTLPISNKQIKVRFPTGFDLSKAKISAEKRASLMKKSTSDFLPIFTTVSVLDVDNFDIVEKAEWYENLHPSDAMYIDEVFREISDAFGVNLTKDHKCSHCEHEYTTYIDIMSDFFRPYSNISTGITSKTGNLAGITKKSNISM